MAIFQVQTIKTGHMTHISIIYRQTGDILLVSSKVTAAAKWLMKISRWLCKYCKYWIKNFIVTLFQLYVKDDFNALLQWCRSFSHCKITAAKMGDCILPESEKLKYDQLNSTLLKYFTRVEPVEVVQVIGPVLLPAVQCHSGELNQLLYLLMDLHGDQLQHQREIQWKHFHHKDVEALNVDLRILVAICACADIRSSTTVPGVTALSIFTVNSHCTFSSSTLMISQFTSANSTCPLCIQLVHWIQSLAIVGTQIDNVKMYMPAPLVLPSTLYGDVRWCQFRMHQVLLCFPKYTLKCSCF